MNDLEKLLQKDEYQAFLKKRGIQDRLVFMTYGGSHAYGTNVEGSDIDVRGCALNTSEEILLNRDFEQYVKNDEDMDICVYSVNKLLGLLSNCNPNTIEMLGMPIEKYACLSDVGRLLIDNVGLFLSKRAVQSFGGYATQQLRRLGNKAVRKVSQSERERYILDSLNNAKYSFGERYLNGMGMLDLYVDDAVAENLDQEIFMDVDLKHYPLRDYVGMVSELQSIIRSYNKNSKRNEYAASHNKIGKHMMHLIRLYLMCFDILDKGQVITYREDDREYLLEIRDGKYLDENDQPTDEFYDIVAGYEERLKELAEKSNLPVDPDMDAINKLRMKINRMIVESVE